MDSRNRYGRSQAPRERAIDGEGEYHIGPLGPSRSDANGAPNSVPEGAANGAAVGLTAAATDPNGPAVTYSLTDNADGVSTADFDILVTNVVRQIVGLTTSHLGAGSSSATGQVTIDGSYMDPALGLDTHTVLVDWGDGSVEVLQTAAVHQADDTFHDGHAYSAERVTIISKAAAGAVC